jgi:hypothetical protein
MSVASIQGGETAHHAGLLEVPFAGVALVGYHAVRGDLRPRGLTKNPAGGWPHVRGILRPVMPTGNAGDRGAPDSISPAVSPISARREAGAYEALWMEPGASFRAIAARFASQPGALPSAFVLPEVADLTYRNVEVVLARQGVRRFGIRVHGAGDYP